jgi:lipopolysaccharide export system protein LptC
MAAARSLLTYLILIAAVVGSFWVADKLAPPEEPREAKPPGEIDYYARNIRRFTADQQGRRRNVLEAEKLTHYHDDDHSELEHPVLTLFSSDGPPWIIHGERGTVSSRSTDVFLEGPVLVTRTADRKGRTFRAETSNVHVKPDENYGETEDFVEIVSPPDELSGIGMQVHFGKNLKVTVLSSVRRKHEFPPKPARTAPSGRPKGKPAKGRNS